MKDITHDALTHQEYIAQLQSELRNAVTPLSLSEDPEMKGIADRVATVATALEELLPT